jgi:threonine dehydratase
MSEPSRAAHRLSLERIELAARTIDPVFLNSPQFVCEPLGDELGARVTLKVETLNPIRSFKGRGADLCVSRLPADAIIVCASAGNFGQAMAYACRKRKLEITIFASVNANALKLQRMRALGARVELDGEDFDAAKLAAKRFAAHAGALMIEDSLDPATGEGAGTIALELLRSPEPIDTILVPLGNGALLAGVARVMKALRPAVRVVAVQAAGAPAMIESLRANRVIKHDRVATIADGIAVRIPVPEALGDLRGLVDDTYLVDEESILEGMRLLHRHAGIVAEPSGAVGIALLFEHPALFAGQSVATIVCGGNLTLRQMRRWLDS